MSRREREREREREKNVRVCCFDHHHYFSFTRRYDPSSSSSSFATTCEHRYTTTVARVVFIFFEQGSRCLLTEGFFLFKSKLLFLFLYGLDHSNRQHSHFSFPLSLSPPIFSPLFFTTSTKFDIDYGLISSRFFPCRQHPSSHALPLLINYRIYICRHRIRFRIDTKPVRTYCG